MTMSEREVEIGCLPGQERLIAQTAPHLLFVAGVAAGKTEGGARYALKQIGDQPGAVGFIGAQTHAQLARVSLPPLLDLLTNAGLSWVLGRTPALAWGSSRFPPGEHAGILSVRIPGVLMPAQIITGSMENYNAHRGIKAGWYWLDEARDMAEEAYDVILSRLRGQPQGTRYGGVLTTTPNGFGWLHRRFVARPVAGSAIVRAKTTENPFLPPGYVEGLRAQYTERFAKQELEGEFLNLAAGQAYYAFSRARHVAAVTVDPAAPLWYAMDFNVSPLCAVYGQSDAVRASVLGEVFIRGSGRTADAVDEFCRRFEAHGCKRVTVYGDQSGGNRDTRGDRTDYDVIEARFRAAGWAVTVQRNYRNPALIESVETVNALLEHTRVTISPTAEKLIADLEQVAWQEGTRVLDKSNDQLTHCSDAFRYYVFMAHPMPSRRATTANWI